MHNSSKIESLLSDLLKYAKNLGADHVDIMAAWGEEEGISIRNKKVESISQSQGAGFGIRVILDHKQSIVSTAWSEDINTLKEAVKKAIDIARILPNDPLNDLTPPQLLYKGPEVDLDIYDSTKPSSKELYDYALQAEDIALEQGGITNTEGANVGYGTSHSVLVASNGFTHYRKSSNFSSSISLIAGKDSHMQSDYDYHTTRYWKDLISPEELAKSTAQRVVRKLNPKKIKSQVLPVIFEPRVASDLISNFCAAINGRTIIRNGSFLVGKLNQKIFDQSISIIDNPLKKRGLGSIYVDADGIEARACELISNGILNTYLVDFYCSHKINSPLYGFASRSLSSYPTPSTRNLEVKPGNTSLETMIKDIKNGVYITNLACHGANLVTGDLSGGIEGLLIENGEITGPISEMTMASNLNHMFANMTPANDLNTKQFIHTPSLLVESITLGGI